MYARLGHSKIHDETNSDQNCTVDIMHWKELHHSKECLMCPNQIVRLDYGVQATAIHLHKQQEK